MLPGWLLSKATKLLVFPELSITKPPYLFRACAMFCSRTGRPDASNDAGRRNRAPSGIAFVFWLLPSDVEEGDRDVRRPCPSYSPRECGTSIASAWSMTAPGRRSEGLSNPASTSALDPLAPAPGIQPLSVAS